MSDPFDTLGVEPRFDSTPRALERGTASCRARCTPIATRRRPAAERRLALVARDRGERGVPCAARPHPRAQALLARSGVRAEIVNQPKARRRC
jgi:molecular chaperone HscB